VSGLLGEEPSPRVLVWGDPAFMARAVAALERLASTVTVTQTNDLNQVWIPGFDCVVTNWSRMGIPHDLFALLFVEADNSPIDRFGQNYNGVEFLYSGSAPRNVFRPLSETLSDSALEPVVKRYLQPLVLQRDHHAHLIRKRLRMPGGGFEFDSPPSPEIEPFVLTADNLLLAGHTGTTVIPARRKRGYSLATSRTFGRGSRQRSSGGIASTPTVFPSTSGGPLRRAGGRPRKCLSTITSARRGRIGSRCSRRWKWPRRRSRER
jgi:hypothetical protein